MTPFQILVLMGGVIGVTVLPVFAVAQTANPPAVSAPSVPSAPSSGAGAGLPKEVPGVTQKKSEAVEKEEPKGGAGEIHTRSGLKNLDAFFDAHPSIEAELHGKPQLANDKDYIKNHPDFETFLKTHPYVHQMFKENPTKTINRENRYEEKRG